MTLSQIMTKQTSEKTLFINGKPGTYTGDMNNLYQAFGYGKFTQQNGIIYRGYFSGNKTVGYCEKDQGGYVTLGQMRDGKWEGK